MMGALDDFFTETERDRERDARWRARSDRTAEAFDHLGLMRATPWILFGVGALVFARLAVAGGSWFEHFVAVAVMGLGVVCRRIKPGRRATTRVSGVVFEQWAVIGFVVVVAIIATVLK